MDVTRRILMTGSAAVGTAACSPLQVFDAFNPADAGATRVETASYGSDPRQALDVFAPRAGTRGAPVAVFFYGGSWQSGSKAEYAFVGEALAAQGFVAVVADYRLHPQVRFPAFLDDGAGAVGWTRDNVARHGGDPGRIVLVGHSAGAYMAAMLALDVRYLRRAGADPRSVRAFAGLSGPYDFLPLDDDATIKVFGQAPDRAATQPVNFARARIAAFLASGDADTTVRPRNTEALAARLRSAGARVEERIYPGLDHKDTLLALSVLFRGKAPVLSEMTTFLKRNAGGGGAAGRPAAG